MTLKTCSHCGMHHYLGEKICPHCDTLSSKTSIGKTTAALFLGLAIGACNDKEDTDAEAQPAYGVALVDNDEDGFSGEENDCDDQNADVNPDAEEICDDEIDNDCDGDIDAEDADCDES